MISLWVVNSINHPEFKRTFVTSFLHPFFNSITFILTYIATFLNLFLINLCCPSPTSRSIIFNLPPSPPPLSLLSFLSSLPRFHLRLFLIRLFFGRRHKGRVISGEIRLWGRLLPIRNQANYHPCLDFKNLKHAHNLTQTEVDFKIEVMLKKLKTFQQLLFLFYINCVPHTARQSIHTSLTIVVKWQMANAVKFMFAILLLLFLQEEYSILSRYFATTGLYICSKYAKGYNQVKTLLVAWEWLHIHEVCYYISATLYS